MRKKIKYLQKGNRYKKGDTLRAQSGFTFIVDRFYKVSIFDTVYCSGHGVGSDKPYNYGNVGIIVGEKEEDCELVEGVVNYMKGGAE